MNDERDPFEAELDGFPVAADPEHLQARETLEVLISRFTEEVRRGEHPSIEEYARRNRRFADEIRQVFPLVEKLESWKDQNEMRCLQRNVRDEFPLRRLGPYQFLGELGRGGMGIVFEVVRENSTRRFALKLFPWRFATDMEQWRECFRREASTIAGLRHPNIVRVYSFGMRGGYCYYLMQLVRGASLDAMIARLRDSNGFIRVADLRKKNSGSHPVISQTESPPADPPPYELSRESWRAFADIALQVASALEHAHAQGVQHNDMKPANLLLTEQGHVVVTDFGVERRKHAEPSKTEDHPVGTLRFMAPERLQGAFDPRSDIYALGTTLYELVTQAPAFTATEHRELIGHILKSKFRPPRHLNPRIPRHLEAIILNAMARDPAQRYPSAAAMAADLLRFAKGEPVSRRRPALSRSLVNWCRGFFSSAARAR